MSIGGLMGETFIQSEVDFRRERALQQYSRRPQRHHKTHLAWPFHRHGGNGVDRASHTPG